MKRGPLKGIRFRTGSGRFRGFRPLLGGLLLLLASTPLLATQRRSWQEITRPPAPAPSQRAVAKHRPTPRPSTSAAAMAAATRPSSRPAAGSGQPPGVAQPPVSAVAAAPVPAAAPAPAASVAPAPVTPVPVPAATPAPIVAAASAPARAVASAPPAHLSPGVRAAAGKAKALTPTASVPRAAVSHAVRAAGPRPLPSGSLAGLVAGHRRCLTTLTALQRETLVLRSGIGAPQAYTATEVANLWHLSVPREVLIERTAAAALRNAAARRTCASAARRAAKRGRARHHHAAAAAAAASRRHATARAARRHATAQRVHHRRVAIRAATAQPHKRRHRRHVAVGSALLLVMAPLGSLAAAFAAVRRRFSGRAASGPLPRA